MITRSQIVHIGTSRDLRLPKALIEQAELTGKVSIRVERGRLVIEAVRPARVGWAEAARQMREADDHRLLDDDTNTRFDREEWTW